MTGYKLKAAIAGVMSASLIGAMVPGSADEARAEIPGDPLYATCSGPGSDEFGGAALDREVWTRILNESQDRHRLENGALVLPTYKVNSPNVPFIQQELPGTAWQATTQVDIATAASFQQAGLNIWQDSANFVKIDSYASGSNRRLQFTWTLNGVQRNVVGTDSIPLPVGTGSTVWLRVASDGAQLRGEFSVDGATFTPLGRTVPLTQISPTHIGLEALRGATSTAPEIEARFDWFRWTPTADELLACGYVPEEPEEPVEDPRMTAMREDWREVLVGSGNYDPTTEPFASTIQRITDLAAEHRALLAPQPADEVFTDLDTEIPEDMLAALRRVKAMATAWATEGSPLAGDAGLLADTIAALDWLNAHRYNVGSTKIAGDWWFWEIGHPLELNDITVILYDELTPQQRDSYMDAVERFSPTVTRTGANRTWAAMVVGLRGVIVQDEAKVVAARDGIVPVFAEVTQGDGFYADGSFVQHGVYAYTGGYGSSLLWNLSRLLVLLEGSPWEVTHESVANVWSWVAESFDPVMFRGAMMDSVRGREIARDYNQDHTAGAFTLRGILLLAEAAPADRRDELRAVAVRHLLADSLDDFWLAGSVTDVELAHAALAEVSPADDLVGTWAFNGMDRVVHHGDGFALAVAMSSARIATYESISSENFRSWHTGDGMTYLYTGDLAQYGGDWWATVNRYRMPGTTLDTRTHSSRSEGAGYRAPTTFAGGLASPSGASGIAGMELDPTGTDLQAHKSWFLFDDEVVALGAGISASGQTGAGWDGAPRHVETVLDNRRLTDGTGALVVDGQGAASDPGAPQLVNEASWAHLSGASGGIGYVLPEAGPLHVQRDARTGSWRDLRSDGPVDARSNTFVSLWLDHGANPSDASYAYVVLPDATAAETAAYSADSDIRVLANTPALAAVEETGLRAIGANFFADAPTTLGVDGEPFLSSDSRASVMTEETEDGIALTVADVTQSNEGTIELELHREAASVDFASPGVTVVRLTPTVKLSVAVADAHGAPFEVSLTYPLDHEPQAPDMAELSSDNGWDTGLHDGDYRVSMNLWWGSNASRFLLYENGELIETLRLEPSSPSAQHAAVTVTGRPNGRYVYTGELVNSQGKAATAPLPVDVTDANPGRPVVSTDNRDRDGNFRLTANLWWGTNATSYRFFENDVPIAGGTLTASTPDAQRAGLSIEGKAPGTYVYRVEFSNGAGTTSSAPITVEVR